MTFLFYLSPVFLTLILIRVFEEQNELVYILSNKIFCILTLHRYYSIQGSDRTLFEEVYI